MHAVSTCRIRTQSWKAMNSFKLKRKQIHGGELQFAKGMDLEKLQVRKI